MDHLLFEDIKQGYFGHYIMQLKCIRYYLHEETDVQIIFVIYVKGKITL